MISSGSISNLRNCEDVILDSIEDSYKLTHVVVSSISMTKISRDTHTDLAAPVKITTIGIFTIRNNNGMFTTNWNTPK
jgi:hypothetical protein